MIISHCSIGISTVIIVEELLWLLMVVNDILWILDVATCALVIIGKIQTQVIGNVSIVAMGMEVGR